MFKKLLKYFIIWRIILIFIVIAASFFIPKSPLFKDVEPEPVYGIYKTVGEIHKIYYPDWIRAWGNFDGNHYLFIADEGYVPYEYGFFPLFPLTINIFNSVTKIPFIITGQILSSLFFILSLIAIYKLLALDKKENLFSLFLLIIFLYPTSFFYSAIYNDSLFLLLATLSLYYARGKQWIIFGLFGFLATLTRLNGLALFLFGFAEYFFSDHFRPIKEHFSLKKIYESGFFASLLIPLAFGVYLFFVNLTRGNWNLVFKSMSIWHQDKITFPLQVFWRYLKIFWIVNPAQLNYWVAVLETLFVVFYIFIIIWSFRKVRLSYWIFLLVSILIPSLTGTFAGMPRYALHLYPFFLSLSIFLSQRDKVFKMSYFAVSIVLLILYLSLFSQGYFVS